MASSAAMKLSFILMLTLFSSMKTQARDSQFFNKVSTTTAVPNQEQPATTTTVAPGKEQPLNNNQQEEPAFLPENENGYGLYSHETGQLPPSATTTAEPSKEPLPKYLPKNYNPVAYVTEPENVDDSTPSFAEETYANNHENENVNYDNDAQNYYYDNQAQQEHQTPKYRSYTANTFTANNRYNNDNFNYNGGSSFNSGPQGLSDTSLYNGDEESSFRPQGMSDTRSLENGKYFYDVGRGRYSGNHPYESLNGVRARNEYSGANYNGNSYQNQYEFPDEQNLP